VADSIELEARLSALELVVVTHILQTGVSTPEFDPRAFALSRRDAWAAIGEATCQHCETESEEMKFARAYASAMERLGHLLVALAEPVQEAMDEVNQAFGASKVQAAAGEASDQSTDNKVASE
jgi:hypothetical protein